MPHFRTPGPNAKWYLSKYRFRTVANFCLQYRELKAESQDISGIKGVTYTGIPHGSGVGDPTARQAERIAEASRKVEIIERNVKLVAGELSYWMIRGLTEENMTYDKLRYEEGMPLPRNYYSQMRREIYWRIAQEI